MPGTDQRAALEEAASAVRAHSALKPRVAIILGTGLGGLAKEIDVAVSIPYPDLPHFPIPTVETHSGRLLLGTLGGQDVVAMEGRLHHYEGYSMKEITFPVRVMRLLGADVLIVSNACGGMNPLWSRGDLMVLDDHINMLGDNPLIGPNLDDLGPRFPDMSEPYDRELQALAEAVALEQGLALRRGVFVAVTGPNLETRAEYRMLRSLGADVVGMSTVPEVIVARHMDMRVLGLSIITDMGLPDALKPVDVPEIIRVAGEAEPKLTALIQGVLTRMDEREQA
ncbi:MAG: purine-nucleoside phosphorylase [Gemmatimonadota bacterium]